MGEFCLAGNVIVIKKKGKNCYFLQGQRSEKSGGFEKAKLKIPAKNWGGCFESNSLDVRLFE